MTQDPDQRLADVMDRERSGLLRFIRRRVSDKGDVEDILQDVWAELVNANHRLMPIEHVTGWLFSVARNRIIDRFRRKRPELFGDALIVGDDGEAVRMEDLLPSADAGPDAVLARRMILEQLNRALAELPEEQRQVFVGHEIDGRSFKQMAATTGVNVNTLLARKRYAVLHLRQRLQQVFDDLKSERGR